MAPATEESDSDEEIDEPDTKTVKSEKADKGEIQTALESVRENRIIQDARDRAMEFLEQGGELILLVQRAQNLSSQETYLTVKHGKKTFKTKVVKKTDCPSFQERFSFSVKAAAHREDSWLKICAYDAKGLTQKVIGEISLPLSYLEQYSEKAASLRVTGAGPCSPVSAWLNFQDKTAASPSAAKKCRLRYILFFGQDHLPWGTLDVNDDDPPTETDGGKREDS